MSDILTITFGEARFSHETRQVTVYATPAIDPGRCCIPRELAWSSDAIRIVSLLLEPLWDQTRDLHTTRSLLDVPHTTERRVMLFRDAADPYLIRAHGRLCLTVAVVTQHGILRAKAGDLVVHASLAGSLQSE